MTGDQIYADGPIKAEVRLDDGSLWKNVVTEAKAHVAQTLADFRGNFAYNLLDDNKRHFTAQVPVLVQWDDHETRNNWYPGQTLGDERYTERSASLLAAWYSAFQPAAWLLSEPGTRWPPDGRGLPAPHRTPRDRPRLGT